MMRVLLLHNEAVYFAGAERMFVNYVEGLSAVGSDLEIVVAFIPGSRFAEVVPQALGRLELTQNQPFSLYRLFRQLGEIHRWHREARFDLIHGWSARDWELASLAAWRCRCPAIGTLHDHPRAPFISPSRQRLMAWMARWGLKRVVCVSDAVRLACQQAGYKAAKLERIHNGLPCRPSPPRQPAGHRVRIGYLGAFSERKGLRDLFAILDRLPDHCAHSWELHLAGAAQAEEGQQLVRDIQESYQPRHWWPQVKWLGWIHDPTAFLGSLDLLVCPSSEFDPFPTVILEAGQAGLAVLAARVGGIGEIVQPGETGWLFEPGDWQEGARCLTRLLEKPVRLQEAGRQAARRVRERFSAWRMATQYCDLYRAQARFSGDGA